MRLTADEQAERAKAREALFDVARRVLEAKTTNVAAPDLPPEEAAALRLALERHASDLRHDDTDCADALSAAYWSCAEDPRAVAEWAAHRAYLAAVDRPVGAAYRRAAALSVLFDAGRDPVLDDNRRRAQLSLEAELFKATATVRDAAAPFDGAPALEPKEGEPFPVDAAIVAALEATGGPAGRERAAAARATSAERVRAYLADPGPAKARALAHAWGRDDGESFPRFLKVLAWALWRDVVRPSLAASLKYHPPALVGPIVQMVALGLHSANHKLRADGSLVVAEGRGAGELIAHVPAELIEAVRAGVELMGSVAAHKLFQWEVLEGWRRYYDGEGGKAHVLDVPGGWTALCELIGLNPEKDVPTVRAIVEAQARFAFRFPDGSTGNMLVYNSAPARGRTHRAHVRIELGQVLMPGYAEAVEDKRGRGGYAARLARRLVPMLRRWPPLVGRSNDHGRQMSLSMAIVAAMRDQAHRMAEHGGATFELDDFVNLAISCRMPHKSGPILKALDAWTGDGEDSFLYKVERGGNLYTLGRPYAAEREFLEQAGRLELAGRKRGEARARAGKRFR